ncbi:MAG: CRTAC1 family protein [bacterium]|nr:CRTAC1 family protein [bacterium]
MKSENPSGRKVHESRPGAVVVVCSSICLLLGCRQDAPGPGRALPAEIRDGQSTPAGPGIFVDRARESGLDFVQFNGMSGDFYMAEVTGSGGAFSDFDGDGDLDVYLVQGNLLGPGKTIAEAIFPPRYPVPVTDRLYRNDLESGEPRFTDVTEGSGLTASDYGMGVAAGDFDNDGLPDLYVTAFGSNRMLRNQGTVDGQVTFADVTESSGTEDDRWSVPAVFLDYDRDGWLDLFVGNYIAADLVNRPICKDFIGTQDYCGPGAFKAEPDRLFRNRGGGVDGTGADGAASNTITFEDVTEKLGIRSGFGGALGSVAADFNGDGRPDLYVANDGQPNNLWMQQSDGSFADEALLSGCSVNSRGKAEASMGVDAADFDGDGDLDLFMTHLTGETNTLFVNDGAGLFEDRTIDAGLSAASRPFTSFGTAWLDYDNDGWLDLLITNGAVKKIEALARLKDPFPVHQPNQLFRHTGEAGGFEDTTAEGGEVFELSETSRGAVFGDVDNDGDTDVLIVNNNGPARLLINRVGHQASWLGLRLTSGSPARDMLGAQVAVERAGRPTLWRRVRTDGSFGSSNDPRVIFGLGDSGAVDRVLVRWPDGSEETWTDVPAGRYTTLRQGEGTPAD